MFRVSMPNFATSSALVDTATKCFALAVASPSNALRIHFRAVWALVIVSSVVKVLLQTMKSVSSGSRSRVFSWKSLASTFETKRTVSPRSEYFRSAS